MVDFLNFNSLFEMADYFNSDDICKKTIVENRWSDGDVVCPHCGKHNCKMTTNSRFYCTKCNHNFSCTAGTIFENTKVSLRKWFMAMYLISSHKKGVSSHQLARDIKVTQKTAWYMLHKVRSLYAQDNSKPLSGEVECDEVYIGGKEKWKHQSMRTPKTQGRSTKTKTPVFGMMERTKVVKPNGKSEFMSYVRAMVVEKTDKATLVPIIKRRIADDSSVFTDELSAYNSLSSFGYQHQICSHGTLEFVIDGNVYTNNVEGFWSHFRRMITGCYHDVNDEHLQSYINEACFRWNTRKMAESERFALMFGSAIGMVMPNDRFKLCIAA